MTDYSITPRTTVKRGQKNATYDRETVHSILDEAYLCHVGAQMQDKPMVQPTCIWREGERVFIHGSSKNALFKSLEDAQEACITVTFLDGLVLARSAFHHSVNYRSVMIFGRAQSINDPQEKDRLLGLMMQKFTPDRVDDIRPPTPQELKATTVLAFDLKEVSAKIRQGPPVDDEEDYSLPVWAGVIPFATVQGDPIDDPRWINNHVTS